MISKQKRLFDFLSASLFIICSCKSEFDRLTVDAEAKGLPLATFQNVNEHLVHQIEIDEVESLDLIEDLLTVLEDDFQIAFRPGNLFFAEDDVYLSGHPDETVGVSCDSEGVFHISGVHLCELKGEVNE